MEMKNDVAGISLRKAAIIAGVAYLAIFVFGLLTNFFIFERMIVPGDAARTTSNISAQRLLFRLGIAGWLVVLICDTIIVWAQYILFMPVSKSMSLLTALFRLVYVAVFAAALVNLIFVLQLVSTHERSAVFAENQLQSQVMLFLNAYEYGFHFGIIFFAFHVFLLGYLMIRSGYMPKLIGILLIIAAAGYLVDSFGNILSTAYAGNETIFLAVVAVPAIVAELSFTLWLLVRAGRNTGGEPSPKG